MELFGGNTSFLVMYIIAFVAIMYFLIFRPQKKREKKAAELVNSLQVGADIITIGGICGKVVNLNNDELTIETSIEKTKILFKKSAIREIVKSNDSVSV